MSARKKRDRPWRRPASHLILENGRYSGSPTEQRHTREAKQANHSGFGNLCHRINRSFKDKVVDHASAATGFSTMCVQAKRNGRQIRKSRASAWEGWDTSAVVSAVGRVNAALFAV